MYKITGISDGHVVIPVGWKLNAAIADEDIPLHNAIIMGAVMARKIDKMHLWDGNINITQPVSNFLIYNQAPIAINVIANGSCRNVPEYKTPVTQPISTIQLNDSKTIIAIAEGNTEVLPKDIPQSRQQEQVSIALQDAQIQLFDIDITINANIE